MVIPLPLPYLLLINPKSYLLLLLLLLLLFLLRVRKLEPTVTQKFAHSETAAAVQPQDSVPICLIKSSGLLYEVLSLN
jgi:hypothetical protein